MEIREFNLKNCFGSSNKSNNSDHKKGIKNQVGKKLKKKNPTLEVNEYENRISKFMEHTHKF